MSSAIVHGFNTGHSLEWEVVNEEETVMLLDYASDVNHADPVTYTNVQFHIHTASEHTIEGEHFDLEMHFVNLDDPYYAVVGVMCNEAEDYEYENEFFTGLLDALNTDQAMIDPMRLFRELDTTKYYKYAGSFTTPGCNEVVQWALIADICTVPKSFMDKTREYSSMDGNYRHTQPLYGREVDIGVADDTTDDTDDTVEYVLKSDYDALAARVDALFEYYSELDVYVNEVDSGVETVATCVAGYLDGRSTDDVTTSERPEDTEEPTDDGDYREVISYVLVSNDRKCPLRDGGRVFKLDWNDCPNTEEGCDGNYNCAVRCWEDADCAYFSTDGESFCIGCDGTVMEEHVGADYYEPILAGIEDDNAGRRQLNEIEALKRENAQLREMLKRRL